MNISSGSEEIIPIKVYTLNAKFSVRFTSSFTFPFQIHFVQSISEDNESEKQLLFEQLEVNHTAIFSVQDIIAPSVGYFVLSFNNKRSWISSLAITDMEWTITNDSQAPCYAIGSVLVNSEPENPRDMQLTAGEAGCLTYLRGYIETNSTLANVPMCGGVPLKHDTDTILRFARARDLKPKKAIQMLKKHIEWRSENLPIPQSNLEKEKSLKRIYSNGRTLSGRHLVIVRCYRILNEGYDRDTLVNVQLDLVRQFEEIDRQESWNDRGTRHPATYTSIIDCTGIRKPPTDYLNKLAEIFADNYPERSHKTIIVPVPNFVRVLVNGMLWFLDPVTRAKIVICSTNEQCAIGCELSNTTVTDIMNESIEFIGKTIGDDNNEIKPNGGACSGGEVKDNV